MEYCSRFSYFLQVLLISLLTEGGSSDFPRNCSKLHLGQFACAQPEIDPDTQQPRGCTKENIAKINCTTAEGIVCLPGTGLDQRTFETEIPCKYTNGYSFETALLLSIFLGMFGVDRFYLGYPAIGLVKFCTFGFMLLGHLLDILLIALQTVGPADGSHYVINYFGPVLNFIRISNDTYLVPKNNW